MALQSTDALVALSQLQDPIISECMKGAGFEYQPEAASLRVQSFGDFLAKRYLSPVRAADGRWGYVFSGRDIVDPEQPALPPSAASAYFGADVGQRELVDSDGNSMGEVRIGNGCLGQAQARVLGSPEEYLSFMSDVALSESILSKSYSLLLSDPEFSKRTRLARLRRSSLRLKIRSPRSWPRTTLGCSTVWVEFRIDCCKRPAAVRRLRWPARSRCRGVA